MLDKKRATELQSHIELAHKVREFLEGELWNKFRSDYFESAIKGLNDIASVNTNSGEDCLTEIKGRKFASNYLLGFEMYMQALIDEGRYAFDELQKSGTKDIVRRG